MFVFYSKNTEWESYPVFTRTYTIPYCLYSEKYTVQTLKDEHTIVSSINRRKTNQKSGQFTPIFIKNRVSQ